MMISGMFAFHTVVNLVATAFFICSRLKLVPPTATRQDQTYGWKFQLEIPMAIKINLIFSFYIQVKVSCSCERAKWECCGSWRIPYCKNPNQHCNALDCHRWCFIFTLFIINPCITVLIPFTSSIIRCQCLPMAWMRERCFGTRWISFHKIIKIPISNKIYTWIVITMNIIARFFWSSIQQKCRDSGAQWLQFKISSVVKLRLNSRHLSLTLNSLSSTPVFKLDMVKATLYSENKNC